MGWTIQNFNIDGKMAHLDYNNEFKLYSVDKLKKYNVDEASLLPPEQDHSTQAEAYKEDAPDLLDELSKIVNDTSSSRFPPTDLAHSGVNV